MQCRGAGGAALGLAVEHAGLKVTLDQTFSSMHEVALHVGRSLFDELVLA